MTEDLNKVLIEVCLKIARRGEGGLIVLGEVNYKPLVKQEVNYFNVIENPKLLESLILMDGAVVIKRDGTLEAYGVKIQSNNILPNFGTRHSAAVSASMNKGNVIYLISEEERKVKVFKEGKLFLQIDALEKGIEKNTGRISEILESLGVGTLGSLGASALVPTLGITFFPGLILFGTSYFLINQIKRWEKKK